MNQILTVPTHSKTELVDITSQVEAAIRSENVRDGFCFLFVPHTTAAVTINEGADPAVKADILLVLNKMVPWEEGYKHLEGNSPAHVKASIIGPSQIVAIEKGRIVLGTWQKVFFCEFDGPRTRKIHIRTFT
jgi:secondary thiamine-phosphate synthase enzyme